MLYSLHLGRRFGLITIDRICFEGNREQAVRLGLADQIVGVEALSASPEMLVAAFDVPAGYAEFVRRSWRRRGSWSRPAPRWVLSAGGLFALLSAHERFLIDDAVVLNPIAVSLRAAETAAWLRAHDGTEVSRASVYAKPPAQAVEELRRLVTGRLCRPGLIRSRARSRPFARQSRRIACPRAG